MDDTNNQAFQKDDEEYRKLIRPVSFAITARIAMQLGRESISNSIVAIIELVKNAYDADAENISISFLDLDTDEPTLVIEDDGNGMNLTQMTESWLVIGTDNKVVTQKSRQKKRPLTGEKGLGRLGLDRLCKSTLVQTFTEDNNFGIELEIYWNKYENTTANLESIQHNLYDIPKNIFDPLSKQLLTKEKGTRLILRGLKDDWAYEDLQMLHTELTLLVSPFAGTNDFSINFFANTVQEIGGQVTSGDLLFAAEWKVASKLEFNADDALISIAMSSPYHEATFELPPTPWTKLFPDQRNRVPECGPVNFEFFFIPREEVPALSLKKAQIDKFMDNNQGIRIYRDGFRVMPYGRPNGVGDWLSLSLRRTRSPTSVRGPMGSWRLGYNQVVGAIYISREVNSKLSDQTNREGIVEGPAFYDFRRFALYAIEYFEEKRQTFEKAQGPKRSTDALEKAKIEVEVSSQASIEAVDQLKDTIDSAVRALTQTARGVSISERESLDISSKLTQMANAVNEKVSIQQSRQEELIKTVDRHEEERQEEFQKQKDTLNNLASLGILTTAFGHETEGASSLLLNNSQELKEMSKEFIWIPQDTLNSIIDIIDAIEYGSRKINTFATFALRNISRDKRKRKNIYLDKLIKDVFENFC